MSMVMAVAVRMVARMVVRVTVAGGVGMGVHCYQVYSTSLRSRAHPKVLSCYWKL